MNDFEQRAHASASRIVQQAPALTRMLDGMIDDLNRRWWHRLFPVLDRRRLAKAAAERALVEEMMDRIYASEDFS